MHPKSAEYLTIDSDIETLLSQAEAQWGYDEWEALIETAQAIVTAATTLLEWDKDREED